MAGVVPVIRVLQESLAAAHVERIHGIVNGTTNFILSEMARAGMSYEQALAQAQELGYAEADPTDDVTGLDAAAKMAILARLAFDTPGPPRPGPLRGDRAPHAGRHRLRAAARARAEADRHRGARRRRAQRPRAPRVPLRRPPARVGQRPVQRGHGRVRRDHRDHACPARAPAARRPRRAVLGDVISAMIPPATTPETTQSLPIVNDVENAFYLHMEVADRPGRARPGRRAARHAGRVDQVGRPARAGRQRLARDGRSTRCWSRASTAPCG